MPNMTRFIQKHSTQGVNILLCRIQCQVLRDTYTNTLAHLFCMHFAFVRVVLEPLPNIAVVLEDSLHMKLTAYEVHCI